MSVPLLGCGPNELGSPLRVRIAGTPEPFRHSPLRAPRRPQPPRGGRIADGAGKGKRADKPATLGPLVSGPLTGCTKIPPAPGAQESSVACGFRDPRTRGPCRRTGRNRGNFVRVRHIPDRIRRRDTSVRAGSRLFGGQLGARRQCGKSLAQSDQPRIGGRIGDLSSTKGERRVRL
jgi:hypothetical protein